MLGPGFRRELAWLEPEIPVQACNMPTQECVESSHAPMIPHDGAALNLRGSKINGFSPATP